MTTKVTQGESNLNLLKFNYTDDPDKNKNKEFNIFTSIKSN